MKRTLLSLLFLLSGATLAAEDTVLLNAVNARLAQLQAEVWQLDDAIYKLGNLELTDAQMYESLAEQNFSATNEIVASYGLTLKRLYAFESDHRVALDAWLEQHPEQANEVNALEEQIMLLQQQFDQLIDAGSG